jgi:CRISPR-associated endoribonuclease Cas6
LQAERANIHLPLRPQETYMVRLTLLLGELFPLFYEALAPFDSSRRSTEAISSLQFGKQRCQLEEIVLTNEDTEGWTGFTSLNNLVEQASRVCFRREATLTLEFASLTTFSRGNHKTGYGAHAALFPLPQYVFFNLATRWSEIAPPELADVVQPERLEQYLQEDGVVITDYDLHPHHVHFTTHQQPGFLGTCTYQLRGPDEYTTPEAPLTLRQQIYLLAQLAFYSGVGYKTAMGMGQTRLKESKGVGFSALHS